LSPRFEFYVDLQPSLEEIWAKFKDHRRRNIRKAEKLGVQTRRENTEESFDLLMSFQADSMRRRNVSAPQSPEHVVSARRKQLTSGDVDIFVSYHEGAPVNATLFGVFNNRPYYHVSGSSDDGYQCCGPVHLIWTAIQHYKERGATCLNLGGVLEDQTGLYRFKQDFGATVISQPIGAKRISKVGSSLHKVRALLRR
jgi:lipid II:glycine glycyltransferase (peptidoglycan interpeptide bridge formation enzyme)